MLNDLDYSATECGALKLIDNYLKVNRDNLNIAHMNVRSWNPGSCSHKIDFYKSLKNAQRLSLFGVTESWLKSYISNKSIMIHGFNVVRNDRPRSKGGGVALYIKKDCATKLLPGQQVRMLNSYLLRSTWPTLSCWSGLFIDLVAIFLKWMMPWSYSDRITTK